MLSTIEVLGSSSKGNAYVLTFDNGKIIQLDAGVKNPNKKDVKQIFLTHEHTDHNKFIKDYDENIIVRPQKKSRYFENNQNFSSINLYHVGLDKKPLDTNLYYIKEDDEFILYLTDCGSTVEVENLQIPKTTIALIECNWDYPNIKNGVIKLEEYGKRSIEKGGHLSNLDCLKLIGTLKLPPTCKILFVHKSEHHTNQDTYKIFDCIPNKKIIAEKGQKIYAKSWKAC